MVKIPISINIGMWAEKPFMVILLFILINSDFSEKKSTCYITYHTLQLFNKNTITFN